jgi:hypothetical protein
VRVAVASGLSAAASLVIIIAASFATAGLTAGRGAAEAAPGAESGMLAGGVFAPGSVSGYVVIGVLAFALGCAVTILCYRIRRRETEASHDRDSR